MKSRFLTVILLILPSLIIETLVQYYGGQWMTAGIFQINWLSFDLVSLYIIGSGILKFILLGIIYWFGLYLLISVPWYLITGKFVRFPSI